MGTTIKLNSKAMVEKLSKIAMEKAVKRMTPDSQDIENGIKEIIQRNVYDVSPSGKDRWGDGALKKSITTDTSNWSVETKKSRMELRVYINNDEFIASPYAPGHGSWGKKSRGNVPYEALPTFIDKGVNSKYGGYAARPWIDESHELILDRILMNIKK